MSDTTTDLEELKFGAKFTWGKVIAIRYINWEYSIVEYVPDGCDNIRESKFYLYFNGKELFRSTDSFDEALIILVVYKYKGPSYNADKYFMEMVKEENDK